jgi:FtsH-binding integral membrane protein
MTDGAWYDTSAGTRAYGTVTLFGQTMTLVAATGGLFALAAYLGRDLSDGWGWLFFIAAFACLFAMRLTVRRSSAGSTGLLLVFGTLMGLATAPTLAYYAATDPSALWQAGGATALFIAGLGAAGYGSRRDLSGLARVSLWALVGLIVLGVVMIFVNIPGGAVVYSVAGLVIFAGLTVVDFQRLRTGDADSAPISPRRSSSTR